MCLFDLIAEFAEWVITSNHYTIYEKRKNLNEIKCYLILSAMSFIWILFISTGNFSETMKNFYSVLFYALLIDITFYIFRFGWLNRANVYREPHFYLFVHMIIHEVFVGGVGFELYVAFSSGSESSKMRDDMGKLTVPLILIALRTFFYFVITILVLLFSPGILCGIVSKRRERLRLIQELQFERRNGSILQYARNSIADNAQDFLYDNQQPLIRRRNTVGEVLANLVNGNQLVPQRLDHFGGLKRVSYNEEQYRLDYPECPIGVTDFSEAQDEYLIYLPCNRNHIFHENGIIPWLRQHPNCPLCKANVNNDAINRYAQ